MVTQIATLSNYDPKEMVQTELGPIPQVALDLRDTLLGMGFSKEELLAHLEKSLGPPWPEEYVNRDTGKVYKPHHDLEREIVYSDTPTYVLVKGSEGCIAAETLIEGVPIADLVHPSLVTTVFGPVIAGAAFQKGRADLYCLQTQSESEVVVTSRHRFLTPFGWRPLQSLSVGDVVAFDGTWNERSQIQTTSDSQDYYSSYPHLGDGLPNPVELVALDKLLQLHRFVCGDSALCPPFPFHSYRTRSSSRVGLTRRLIGFLLREILSACVFSLQADQGCELSPHKILQHDTFLPIHPLGDRICGDGWGETQRRTCFLGDGKYTAEMYRSLPQSDLWYDLLATIPISSGDQIPCNMKCVPCGRHSSLRYRQPTTQRLQALEQPPYEFPIPYTSLLQRLGQYLSLSSTHNYNIHWTEIQDISFVKEGDFYDLHVPFWNHYSAHGLLHHNSGKSVLGVVKALNRVKRKCSGALISPDFPHLRKSLWLEARRWIPWDQVVDKHRYMEPEAWQPYSPFRIVFKNGASLEVGGIDEPGAWEGPNINFALMDEMRRKKTAEALKVLAGRVRIPGPDGTPPQLFITTTPRKNWLWSYYGPLQVKCKDCMSTEGVPIQEGKPLQCMNCGSKNLEILDELADFKFDSRVITLHIRDNEINLQKGFAAKRALVLSEAESRVLIDAEWEDLEESEAFLPHISWWDDCEGPLPRLAKQEPLVLAVDAATGRTSGVSDCFGILGITRHPDPSRKGDTVAVRYINTWQAKRGKKIDFLGTPQAPGPERELLRLCGWKYDDSAGQYVKVGGGYNVKCICFDPDQLHDLGMRFTRKRIAWMREFGQGTRRIEADTDLLHLIQNKRVAHDGDSTLREHISNADRKLDDSGKRLRIIKREDQLKIDLCICLSMGAATTLYLQLGGK